MKTNFFIVNIKIRTQFTFDFKKSNKILFFGMKNFCNFVVANR